MIQNPPNPDQFECTQCSALISIAESKCPQCGLDFYPEQIKDKEEETKGVKSLFFGSAKGLAIYDFIIGGLLLTFTIVSMLQISEWELKYTRSAVLLGLLAATLLLAGIGIWKAQKWAKPVQIFALIAYGINLMSIRIPKDFSYFAQGDVIYGLSRLVVTIIDIFFISFLGYIAWKKIN